MPVKITMPALSPTMEEGNLAKWLVKEGDKVNPGDVIAEIETDKATMEVEAVDEGILARIIVPAGTLGVKVNSVIAVLAEEGEDVAAVAKSADGADGESAAAAPVPPVARPGQVAPEPDKAAATSVRGPAIWQQADGAQGGRVFSSPLARRLAAQSGIDLAVVAGSGPHGRVIKRDVEVAAAGAKTAEAGHSAPFMADVPSDEALLKLFTPGEYDVTPHSGMRKTIARRLVESKQTVPHFYVTVDCEIDALLKLRSGLNNAAPARKTEDESVPAYRLSVNDMIIKAVALALKQVPDANVSWLDSGMVRHAHADVGVAVSIENGLITPIIRHADEKSLQAISNEMKELVKRARQMKLKPEEYQGGTTAVSNMGMFGVKAFSAIINPPQATIFAIGAGEKRALVRDDALGIATVMTVSVSADHRAVDGALAAELAQAFKELIENPLVMLV